MHLSRADLTTKVPARRRRALERACSLEQRVRQVTELDSRFRLPKHTMGMILERAQSMGRPPGPWLSAVKDELERRVIAGELAADPDPRCFVDAGLAIAFPAGLPGTD